VQPVVTQAYQPDASPFDEPSDVPGTRLAVDPAAQAIVADVSPGPIPQTVYPPVVEPVGGSPFEEPSDRPAAPVAVPAAAPPQAAPPRAPARAPAAPAAQAAEGDSLLAAFMDGAGMADIVPADPSGTMRALGAAFRSLVGGLRAVLIARASIKSEFRIEQTMIRARGNNPLKFSAGDDDALSALLGSGRRTDMTPAAAVEDALKDIRLHELASMAAMQAAVRSMLDGLEPTKLRAAAEQGGMAVLPAQKKARAWDAYEALHAKTVQALSDDFDSIFGKAFARAYERALDDVSAKERR
jgi:type VI secretion system FHA domain protein